MFDGLDYFYNTDIIKRYPKMNFALLRQPKNNKSHKVFYLQTLYFTQGAQELDQQWINSG